MQRANEKELLLKNCHWAHPAMMRVQTSSLLVLLHLQLLLRVESQFDSALLAISRRNKTTRCEWKSTVLSQSVCSISDEIIYLRLFLWFFS